MILLALWFVLPPLLQKSAAGTRDESRAASVLIYQDQYQELEADFHSGLMNEEQYQQEKDELERRLLEDIPVTPEDKSVSSKSLPAGSKIKFAVGAISPVAAVVLYFVLGNPRALTTRATPTAMPPVSVQPGQMTPQNIEANVAALARRLEQDPNDAQGWIMLGRSYTAMNRFADAASAYERATGLKANDAELWADYAEALALANGQRMAGRPVEAANRALQLEPKNEKALTLAGAAAFEAADYEKAIGYWQKLLPLLPPNSEMAKAVSAQLARARELAAARRSG